MGTRFPEMLIVTLLVSGLSGCTTAAPYRTIVDERATDCSQTLEQAVPAACQTHTPEHTANYDLYFVEFDDQGLLYPQHASRHGDAWQQLDFLMKELRELADKHEGISLFVYVHGWKHNASADDDNVQEFRDALLATDLVEKATAKDNPGVQPRKVVGIYVGWRGRSMDLGEPLNSLSFWDRKFTAQHVAEGSARELFARLRGFQRTENRKSKGERPKVRAILIGHSFGGLILFNAISGSLIEALTSEDDWGEGGGPVARFGDMVVLINPAFEATRYSPLHRVATRRRYSKYRAPILVSVTSTADWATRTAFPFGRFFNTIFETTASTEESTANNNTIGHVQSYITHHLSLSKERMDTCAGWQDIRTVKREQIVEQLRVNLKAERKAGRLFVENNMKDNLLRESWTRTFCGGAVLSHVRYDPNSLIWNVQTDGDVISGHNEITGSAFSNFLRQLYHDSVLFAVQ